MSAAARALACVGVRYRPGGRDPATGLDCVGLALVASGRDDPGPLPRRFADRDAAVAMLDACFVRLGAGAAGDIVLVDAGARQLHLAVLTAGGFVHACARARRVVAVPGAPVGAIGYWRG